MGDASFFARLALEKQGLAEVERAVAVAAEPRTVDRAGLRSLPGANAVAAIRTAVQRTVTLAEGAHLVAADCGAIQRAELGGLRAGAGAVTATLLAVHFAVAAVLPCIAEAVAASGDFGPADSSDADAAFTVGIGAAGVLTDFPKRPGPEDYVEYAKNSYDLHDVLDFFFFPFPDSFEF